MLRWMVVVLAGLALSSAMAEEPVPQAELRGAIEKTLPLLLKGAVGHREQRKTCFSCHNQGVPIVALTTAKLHGLTIDEPEMKTQQEFIAIFLKTNRERFLEGRGTGGEVDTAGYALLSLELGGWMPDDTTAAVTEYLLLYQKDADHWKNGSDRPPSEGGQFTTNYLGLRGLSSFGTEAQKDRVAARREQVRGWVQKTEPKETEDFVFRLRLLKLLSEPTESIASALEALKKLQREDGGWSQKTDLESDAYATGSALVALHESGLATSDPVYQRGLRFLLKTQHDDGSWHVVSRSKPFQKYFESGFPHGKDQFISSAASGWSTTAIALAIEPASGGR